MAMLGLEEKFVDDVLRLVSIKSFTNDSAGVLRCQQEYQKIAERMGFVTYFKANGKVLIVEPAGMTQIPEIGMVVHLDTVPFDDAEWTVNPLGEIKDGRIFGRGVVDDKAAAVMALYAVYSLKGKIHDSWQIIVGSCEEGDWSDMDLFMKENPKLAKFLFTIDGDGIQHGCRGYVDMELIFKREVSSNVTTLCQMSVPNATNNMVPAQACANIKGKECWVYGVAAHSSIPEAGENALTKLVRLIAQNKTIVSEFPGFFELMSNLETTNLKKSVGFPIDRITCEDGCYTTVVPVDCKILNDDYLVLTLNIRLCVHMASSMVSEMLSYISQTYNCNCYIKDFKLPAYVEPDSKYVMKMLESYNEILGKPTVSRVALGTGYNATLPNCVIFGPRFDNLHDERDFCHSADESRKISDLMIFLRMLKLYLKKMLSN